MVYYFPSNAQKSAHWKRLFSQYRHQDCPGTFLQLRGYCNCKTVCIFSPLLLQYCLSDFLQGLVASTRLVSRCLPTRLSGVIGKCEDCMGTVLEGRFRSCAVMAPSLLSPEYEAILREVLQDKEAQRLRQLIPPRAQDQVGRAEKHEDGQLTRWVEYVFALLKPRLPGPSEAWLKSRDYSGEDDKQHKWNTASSCEVPP